jgi:hypothetical protein
MRPKKTRRQYKNEEKKGTESGVAVAVASRQWRHKKMATGKRN